MDTRTVGVEEELLVVDPATRAVTSRAPQVLKEHAEQAAATRPVARATSWTRSCSVISSRSAPTRRATSATPSRQVVAGRRTAGEAAALELAVAVCASVPLAMDEPVISDNDALSRHGGDVRPDRAARDHVRDARPRGHRVRRGGGLLHRPDIALVAGPARRQRQLALRRGARHRLRLVADPVVVHVAQRRSDRALRLARRLPPRVRADDRERRGPRSRDALLRRAAVRGQPTLEVRILDAVTDPQDVGLLTALVRALVETAADDWPDGLPVWRAEELRAARWRASRYGLADQLLDPVTHALRPAREVLTRPGRPGVGPAGGNRRRRAGGARRGAGAGGHRRDPSAGGVRAHRIPGRRRRRRRSPGLRSRGPPRTP